MEDEKRYRGNQALFAVCGPFPNSPSKLFRCHGVGPKKTTKWKHHVQSTTPPALLHVLACRHFIFSIIQVIFGGHVLASVVRLRQDTIFMYLCFVAHTHMIHTNPSNAAPCWRTRAKAGLSTGKVLPTCVPVLCLFTFDKLFCGCRVSSH